MSKSCSDRRKEEEELLTAPPISTLGGLKQLISKHAFRSWHFDFSDGGRLTVHLHPDEFERIMKAVKPRMDLKAYDNTIFKKATLWSRVKMAYHNMKG